MSLYVVDVSVGVKWFIPEVATPDALRLRSGGHELHVPAFFAVEFANILWKKIRRSEISRTDADDVLSQLPALPLTRHSDAALVPSAFDLADQTGQTVYDCLYLALAVRLGGVMVTADDRLVNSLSATQWAASAVRVQDAP